MLLLIYIENFQINYDANYMVVGSKIDTYLFGNSRACSGSYSNFHIFYYLRYGAPDNLKGQLSIEEKSGNFACQKSVEEFAKVDQMFGTLQITGDKKKIIYNFLGAIVHLNNIEFGCNDPDDPHDKSYIVKSTEHHVEIAAHLLEQPADKLKSLLLYHSIKVADSEIM